LRWLAGWAVAFGGAGGGAGGRWVYAVGAARDCYCRRTSLRADRAGQWTRKPPAILGLFLGHARGRRCGGDWLQPFAAWAGLAAAIGAAARFLHPGGEPGGSVDHRSTCSARAGVVRACAAATPRRAGGAAAAAHA